MTYHITSQCIKTERDRRFTQFAVQYSCQCLSHQYRTLSVLTSDEWCCILLADCQATEGHASYESFPPFPAPPPLCYQTPPITEKTETNVRSRSVVSIYDLRFEPWHGNTTASVISLSNICYSKCRDLSFKTN